MTMLVRTSLRVGTTATSKPQHVRNFSRRAPDLPPASTTASVLPPNAWITQAELIPRPPADSLLDVMYARSSNTRRSTVMVRSIAGLTVRVTIKNSILANAYDNAADFLRLDATLRLARQPWNQGVPRSGRRLLFLGHHLSRYPDGSRVVSAPHAGLHPLFHFRHNSGCRGPDPGCGLASR